MTGPRIGCRLAALALACVLAGPAVAQEAGPRSALGGLDRGPPRDPTDDPTVEERERLEQHDRQRRAAAAGSGGSHMPFMPGPVTPGIAPAPPAEATGAERLARAFGGPRAPRPAAPAAAPPPQGDVSRIEALLGGATGPGGFAAWTAEGTPTQTRPAGAAAAPAVRVTVPAGDAAYAALLAEVNSDLAGPAVAELLSGPLRGARAVGSFRAAGETMVLRFDRLFAGGTAIAIDAWGVDPGCACYGIDGEVDRHWVSRVILPSAASFATGFLRAASRPDTQVVIDGSTVIQSTSGNDTRKQLYAGGAEAVERASNALAAGGPTEPTVRVPAGTELLVMFVEPVFTRDGGRRAGP